MPTILSNTNGFPVEPPRGFEPRTYALRDCTYAWIHPYELLPINDFRDTEEHPDTPSDTEKGRRKGRAFMRRLRRFDARTYASPMRFRNSLDQLSAVNLPAMRCTYHRYRERRIQHVVDHAVAKTEPLAISG